ncbi:MAG: alginate lyase family protein [Planctomycetota bacterium]
MPVAEIRGRIAHRLRGIEDRVAVQLGRDLRPVMDVDVETVWERCQDLVPGARDISHGTISVDSYQKSAAHLQAQSQAIRDGRVSLLGVDFSIDPCQWHRDPLTGHEFESVFAGAVNTHQHGRDAIDVKHVWELSRHQFIVPLAQHSLLTSDEESALLASSLICDWIDNNPYRVGVHWTSALEVGIRIFSWIWCMACIGKQHAVDQSAHEQIVDGLYKHGHYLYRNLSHFSSPYNHLVGECSALYWVAYVLQDIGDARAWKRRAVETLNQTISKQFYADGFSLEQSSTYQYFTLGFLCLAQSASKNSNANDLEFGDWLSRANQAGSAFRMTSEEWASVGDCDSARAIPIFPPNEFDFRGVHNLCEVLTGGEDFFEDEGTEETFWLLGDSSVNILRRSGTANGPAESNLPAESNGPSESNGQADRCTMIYLPEAGYAGARTKDDWIILDCGPVADGLFQDETPSTAHGHLDVLQVLASLDGSPLLIDSGIPHYFQSDDALEYFRNASSHNTISIEDRPFARSCGPLMWNRVDCRTQLPAPVLSNDNVIISGHAGWESNPESMTRTVVFNPERGLLVADRLASQLVGSARWHWHLAPEHAVKWHDRCSAEIGSLRFYAGSNLPKLRCESETCDDGPQGTKVSCGYGVEKTHSHFISRLVGSVDDSSEDALVVHVWLKKPQRVRICGDADSIVELGHLGDEDVWALELQ